MKIFHIRPPDGTRLAVTIVQWVLEQHAFGDMLDSHLFEAQLTLPSLGEYLQAVRLAKPKIVVLPDTLGKTYQTHRDSFEVLRALPLDQEVMYVPQAQNAMDWLDSLSDFGVFGMDRPFIVGLTSLRREGSLRPQMGTRIGMMQYLCGLRMHLLGFASVRYFYESELPVALECGVESMCTCQCFALAARGLELTKNSPRVFLGSNWEADPKLFEYNKSVMESWIKE